MIAAQSLALVLLAAPARALEIPELRAHVVDRAQLLSADREAALEGRLQRFEDRKGTHVVVHTTPSLEGLDIETYSIRIAKAWKVGRRGIDDGVILTVAPNERKVRIEVGYGLEAAIPDGLATNIIQQEILPSFREERFADGIERGVDSILTLAAGEALPAPTQPGSGLLDFTRPGSVNHDFATLGFFVFALLALVFICAGSSSSGGSYDYDRRRSGIASGMYGGGLYGSRRMYGGGGGSVFGGGSRGGGHSSSSRGGGRFGGGGASGSW